jgi:energy-coupling factor transport system substrate-specific component
MLVTTIALVAGIITALNNTAYVAIFAGGGAFAAQALIGVSTFCALFAPYVVRRPGAALLSQLIIGLVQTPLSASGWIAVVFLLPYGILAELAFGVTRYRASSLPFMAIAGGMIGLVMLLIGYVPNGFQNLAASAQALLVVMCVASAALGGVLAKLLADRVSRAGLFSGMTRLDKEEV